jgi:hypothetical protein
MKIYVPKKLHLIRLTISQSGEDTKYINFIETTQEECIKEIISIIESLKLSVFSTGTSTRLDFRDCVGGKNGKVKV